MEKPDHVVLWMDQSIEGMSLEELREAFQDLARLYAEATASHGRTLDAWKAAQDLRMRG